MADECGRSISVKIGKDANDNPSAALQSFERLQLGSFVGWHHGLQPISDIPAGADHGILDDLGRNRAEHPKFPDILDR